MLEVTVSNSIEKRQLFNNDRKSCAVAQSVVPKVVVLGCFRLNKSLWKYLLDRLGKICRIKCISKDGQTGGLKKRSQHHTRESFVGQFMNSLVARRSYPTGRKDSTTARTFQWAAIMCTTFFIPEMVTFSNAVWKPSLWVVKTSNKKKSHSWPTPALESLDDAPCSGGVYWRGNE